MELAIVSGCLIVLAVVCVWVERDTRRFERQLKEYEAACDKAMREAIDRDYRRRVLKKWGVEDEL